MEHVTVYRFVNTCLRMVINKTYLSIIHNMSLHLHGNLRFGFKLKQLRHLKLNYKSYFNKSLAVLNLKLYVGGTTI